jgi:hypothetical protein
MQRTAVLISFFIAALVGFSACAGVLLLLMRWNELDWTPRSVARTKSVGNTIIQELDRFRDVHGHYPESLHDLEQAVGTPIHQPEIGARKWEYRTDDNGDNFTLRFATKDGYPSCWYASDRATWYLDD